MPGDEEGSISKSRSDFISDLRSGLARCQGDTKDEEKSRRYRIAKGRSGWRS